MPPRLVQLFSALARLQVPSRFKEYTLPKASGGYGVKLAKAKQGSFTRSLIQSQTQKLRTALDVPSFARSELWRDFRDDADQLHSGSSGSGRRRLRA